MFVTKQTETGWRVVTAFMRNEVDKTTLKAARIPEGSTSYLTQKQADDIASKLNKWIASQEPKKKGN